MTRVKVCWAGFVNDAIYFEKGSDAYDEPRLAIFNKKKEALRAYEDVRRVIIVWQTRP